MGIFGMVSHTKRWKNLGLACGMLLSLSTFNQAWSNQFEKNRDVQFLGIESYRDIHMWNWAQNVQFKPELVFVPKSKQDLISIVKSAGENHKRITIIGKGHSWNPLMEGSDYLISTTHLNKVWIHPEETAVTVEAGATIHEVDQIIEPQGFMVPCNIVGTTDITYGGIMATGSHGSGRSCQTMSDFIEEIEFVKSNGETEVVSESTHGSEVMNAARLNLGLFGIMYRIKFKVQKAFNAEVTDQWIPREKLFERLPDLLKQNENVEVLWFPFTQAAVVKSWNPTNLPENSGSWASQLKLKMTKGALYGKALQPIIAYILEHHPDAIPALSKAFSKNLFPNRTYVQNVNAAIHYVNEAVKYPINETEIAVPYDFDDLSKVKMGWDAMVQAVFDNDQKGKHPLDIIVHMRFLKSSNAILSPSYKNTRTCYMDYGSYYKTPGWNDLVNEIWATWSLIPGVKLHWAKDMRAYSELDVRSMYGAENVDLFLKVREQFDPNGMFANDFMKKLFRF